MTNQEIADAVNLSDLYERRDGQPVPASQISARKAAYRDYFRFENGRVYPA
jgi:hypothetical protein